MANYLIIGGDGKEYGPVTDADVRQWIAEGRLNAQTMAKGEGDAEMRPLSAFPEFATVLAAGAPTTIAPLSGSPVSGGREEALRLLNGPIIGLKVTAIIGLVAVAFALVINITTLMGIHLIPQQPMPDPQMQKLMNSIGGGLGIVQDIVGGVIGIVILLGTGKMKRLESYQYAMMTAILAMVPCLSPCCFLGLPFGIWALVVLNKPEVKSHFQ